MLDKPRATPPHACRPHSTVLPCALETESKAACSTSMAWHEPRGQRLAAEKCHSVTITLRVDDSLTCIKNLLQRSRLINSQLRH